MKRFLSVLLCVTMLVTMMFGTVGFAVEKKPSEIKGATSSFTLTGVESGATVKIYKIIDLTFGTNDLFSGYAFVSTAADDDVDVQSWVNSKYLAYADGTNGIHELGKNGDPYSAVEDEFYVDLAAAIQNSTVAGNPNPTPAYTITAGDNNIVVENVPLGQYLAIVTGGTRIYSPTVINLVPTVANGKYDVSPANVAVKSSEVDIKKTVEEEPEIVAGLGTIVEYVIDADVPQYPDNAIDTKFEIKDTMSTGLVLEGAIAVQYKQGGALVDVNPEYYTLTPATTTNTFTISFKKDNYTTIKPYGKIYVTYHAKVTADAVPGTALLNRAELTYSTNPTVEGSYQTDFTETKVYTYGLKVFKYTQEDPTADNTPRTPLYGAIFKLEKKNTDGSYTQIQENETFMSNTEGMVSIENLEPGTYRLVELQAPGGYNKIDTIPDFTIIAETNANSCLTGKVEGFDSAYYRVEVPNVKSVLPITGGTGTLIFTIVGIVLMLGAVSYLVIKKRLGASVR